MKVLAVGQVMVLGSDESFCVCTSEYFFLNLTLLKNNRNLSFCIKSI